MKPGAPSLQSARWLDQLCERAFGCTIASILNIENYLLQFLCIGVQCSPACSVSQPTMGVADGSANHRRTAMPRSRMRALACCTVYSP
jgi:hypothetical protein